MHTVMPQTLKQVGQASSPQCSEEHLDGSQGSPKVRSQLAAEQTWNPPTLFLLQQLSPEREGWPASQRNRKLKWLPGRQSACQPRTEADK